MSQRLSYHPDFVAIADLRARLGQNAAIVGRAVGEWFAYWGWDEVLRPQGAITREASAS